MTKVALKNITVEIAKKRKEVTRLQEDLADMLDHLTILEARAESSGKRRYTSAEVKKTLGI